MTAEVRRVSSPVDIDVIDEAAEVLATGSLVVVPTDTVYGIAAALEPGSGLDRIFEVKARSRDDALPVLVGSTEQARALGRFNGIAERYVRQWWPGALTLVVPRRAGVESDLGGDPASVGIRMPDSDVIREICSRVGPLAATSANKTGEAEITEIDGAVREFKDDVALYLDAGSLSGRRASTVLDLRGEPRILRAGAIDATSLNLAG